VVSKREQEIERAFSLIEGSITDINVEMGRENLLQKIDKRYRGKAVVAGAGAAAGDMFGQVAAAASVAMYEGEDTQNFMCLIDGQVVCGQFGGAQWLREGSRVKAVVTQEEGVLVARGILDEQQGLLWVGHPWGSKAEVIANWKIAFWGYLFGLFGVVIMILTMGIGDKNSWDVVIVGLVIMALIMVVMALWTGRDMKGLSDPSTQVFKLFGFDDPASVNLNKYNAHLVAMSDTLKPNRTQAEIEDRSFLDLAECQYRNVFNYKRAIDDGKLKLASTVERQAASAR
jgi:hypothetical protein